MGRMGKGLAVVLSLMLLVSLLLPAAAETAKDDDLPIIPVVPTYSGVCGADGDNLKWTLPAATGILKITGSGRMMDYTAGKAPWYRYNSKVLALDLSDQTESIGDYAFYGCGKLAEAVLPQSVASIGTNAFFGCSTLSSVTVENPACEIADTIYTLGVPTKTVLHADCGSTTHRYAEKHGYQTVLTHADYTVQTVAPTCTVAGYTVHTCTRCGDSYTDEETPAPGHDYAAVVTEPSCTEGGYTTYTCSRCGDSYTDEETEALGHIWAAPHYDWAADYSSVTAETVCERDPSHSLAETVNTQAVSVDATCTAPGTVTFTAVFSAPEFETQQRVEAGVPMGHDYIAVVTEPTCTEGGYTTFTCSRCGDSYVGEETAALGHDWDAPVYVWSEDNTEVTASRACKHDATHTESETVKTTAAVTKEATVEEEGEITYTATFANAAFEPQTKTAAIPKLEPPTPVNPFEDVREGAFYYDAVLWAVNREPQITNGMDATHFRPNDTCTRGQVVTFLWRAMGCPEPSAVAADTMSFIDIKTKGYYFKAVLWAVENGITAGVDATHFAPERACTRGEVVTFLWRAEGKPAPAGSANSFTDVAAGRFYCDAVLWAVENGITAGKDTSHFAPNEKCTRGQIVTFLYRDLG